MSHDEGTRSGDGKQNLSAQKVAEIDTLTADKKKEVEIDRSLFCSEQSMVNDDGEIMKIMIN